MSATPTIAQAAAIPIEDGRICLVNSSSGRGWVIPKGHIEPGQTAREAALQEAWEEAGLRGVLKDAPVDSYEYEKNGAIYRVVVFLMKVTEAAATWPEDHRRTRRWIRPHEIEKFVHVAGMRGVLGRVQFSRRGVNRLTRTRLWQNRHQIEISRRKSGSGTSRLQRPAELRHAGHGSGRRDSP